MPEITSTTSFKDNDNPRPFILSCTDYFIVTWKLNPYSMLYIYYNLSLCNPDLLDELVHEKITRRLKEYQNPLDNWLESHTHCIFFYRRFDKTTDAGHSIMMILLTQLQNLSTSLFRLSNPYKSMDLKIIRSTGIINKTVTILSLWFVRCFC